MKQNLISFLVCDVVTEEKLLKNKAINPRFLLDVEPHENNEIIMFIESKFF